MQPFKLRPAIKQYLWGGRQLHTLYGVGPPGANIAESWALSFHRDGVSVIADGPHAGLGLDEFARRYPQEIAPQAAPKAPPFMVKLIDAQERLSVQVHPDDEYAARAEGDYGKTEMWIILACRPGAFVYHGFAAPHSRAAVARHLRAGTLPALLQPLPVRPGDVIFVPAGTVHAIGAGILVAEVQESSNATYRLHDYGRTGPDGRPRQLHWEKGLAVMHCGPANPNPPGRKSLCARPGLHVERLAQTPWFTVYRLALRGGEVDSALLPQNTAFASLLCLEGEGMLHTEESATPLAPGDSLFLPASLAGYRLRGSGRFLLTHP